MKTSKQDGWTLTVVSETDNVFKYKGIKELKYGEIPVAFEDNQNAPFLVLVQDEDTWQVWMVRDKDALGVLEAYLDSWCKQATKMLVASADCIRPICSKM